MIIFYGVGVLNISQLIAILNGGYYFNHNLIVWNYAFWGKRCYLMNVEYWQCTHLSNTIEKTVYLVKQKFNEIIKTHGHIIHCKSYRPFRIFFFNLHNFNWLVHKIFKLNPIMGVASSEFTTWLLSPLVKISNKYDLLKQIYFTKLQYYKQFYVQWNNWIFRLLTSVFLLFFFKL